MANLAYSTHTYIDDMLTLFFIFLPRGILWEFMKRVLQY